jgi:hypothetical protein
VGGGKKRSRFRQCGHFIFRVKICRSARAAIKSPRLRLLNVHGSGRACASTELRTRRTRPLLRDRTGDDARESSERRSASVNISAQTTRRLAGNTGWLGVATIWLQSGTTHIVQGTVKNNDYYFGNSSYQYNNTAEMQHVICQEIGHTFGLDHQDETGTPRHQIPRAPTRTSTTTTSWSRSTRTSTPRRQSAQRRPRAWFQPGRWVSRSTSTGSRTG